MGKTNSITMYHPSQIEELIGRSLMKKLLLYKSQMEWTNYGQFYRLNVKSRQPTWGPMIDRSSHYL